MLCFKLCYSQSWKFRVMNRIYKLVACYLEYYAFSYRILLISILDRRKILIIFLKLSSQNTYLPVFITAPLYLFIEINCKICYFIMDFFSPSPTCFVFENIKSIISKSFLLKSIAFQDIAMVFSKRSLKKNRYM